MAKIDDYIEILNLGENFRNLSQEEQMKALAKAWRKFSLKWHPDRNKSPKAEEMFKKGNNANDELKEYIKSGYFSSEESDDDTVDYSTDDAYTDTDYNNKNYYRTESRYTSDINSKFWEKYNNKQEKRLFSESLTPVKIIITAFIISFAWFVVSEFKPAENTGSKIQETTANNEPKTSNINTTKPNETYPSCDGNDTLKPMKKERTEQLKPLLEKSEYYFDADYSLWYRNTTSEGNGYCKSEEMIKNIFLADSNAYIVHPINYKTTYQNGQVVTEHSSFTTLDDLLYNGSVYSGNRKLSSGEIKSLLEQSLNISNYIEDSQTNKPKTHASTGEPDFGPYMRDLQKHLKANWNPPKGNESKRVILLFTIAKDGSLLDCSVYKSSGLSSVDSAALDAVKLTAPFKPLPAEYERSSIDIQFTFDYNVYGATKY